MASTNLPLPEEIRTSRLFLRRLRYEDADEMFFSYASKPQATQFMAWATHQRISDTREFLKYAVQAWDQGTDYSFSIRLKERNRLIGSFGILHDSGRIQFGYVLSPSQWGNGYATEVCQSMMPLLRRMDSIYRIGTFVDAENVASARVLLKAGLVEEARLPKWFRFINQDNNPKDCILFKLPDA